MELFNAYITPQKIEDYQLKRMIIPDVGHRFIYTTNRRYIRPFSVNKDKISHEDFNDLVELYNQEVLYEIEGEASYADSKIAEFAYLLEQLKADFGDYVAFNTLQLYGGESQLIVYFRKSTFIAAVYDKNSDEIQLSCIAPELDFQIDYILSFINQLDLKEMAKIYTKKTNILPVKNISKTIAIYCLKPFVSTPIIKDKFNAQGWEVSMRNQDYIESLITH